MEVRRADGTSERQTVEFYSTATFILREGLSPESAALIFHGSDFRRVTPDDPMRRGEVITVFALGMGDLDPPLTAGSMPPNPPAQLKEPLRVGFWFPSVDLFAGAAPALVGIYQVNLEVPASLQPGSYDRFVGGDRLPVEVR